MEFTVDTTILALADRSAMRWAAFCDDVAMLQVEGLTPRDIASELSCDLDDVERALGITE